MKKWVEQHTGAFDLKTHSKKNFKMTPPRLLPRIIDQMREIACLALFFYGSSQLGMVIDFALSVELHRKSTINHIVNQRKAPKRYHAKMLLHWALCLVQSNPIQLGQCCDNRPSVLQYTFCAEWACMKWAEFTAITQGIGNLSSLVICPTTGFCNRTLLTIPS